MKKLHIFISLMLCASLSSFQLINASETPNEKNKDERLSEKQIQENEYLAAQESEHQVNMLPARYLFFAGQYSLAGKKWKISKPEEKPTAIADLNKNNYIHTTKTIIYTASTGEQIIETTHYRNISGCTNKKKATITYPNGDIITVESLSQPIDRRFFPQIQCVYPDNSKGWIVYENCTLFIDNKRYAAGTNVRTFSDRTKLTTLVKGTKIRSNHIYGPGTTIAESLDGTFETTWTFGKGTNINGNIYGPGTTQTFCHDGTIKIVFAAGTITKGGVIPGPGTTQIKFPDGTMKTVLVAGTTAISGGIYGPGSTITESPDGTRKIIFTKGTTTNTGCIYGQGTTRIFHPDGTIKTIYGPNSKSKGKALPYNTMITHPNKTVELHFPSGKKIIKLPNKDIIHYCVDGRVITIKKNGEKITKLPDGTISIDHP